MAATIWGHLADDELLAQACRPTADGKVALEAKETLRGRIGRSPDRADAVVMAVRGTHETARGSDMGPLDASRGGPEGTATEMSWHSFDELLFPRWYRKPASAPLFEGLLPDDECWPVDDLRQLALRCWTTVLPEQALSMPQIFGRRLPRHHFGLYVEEQHAIHLPAYTGRAVLLHELAHAIRLARYRGESPLCSHDAVFARICLDLWIGAGLLTDVSATLMYAYACGVRITPRLEVEEHLPGLSHWRMRPGISTPPPLPEDRWLIEQLIDETFANEDEWNAWCEGAIAAYN